MTIIFSDLKEAYENAVKKREETFLLDNKEYLTLYAKYLIQYLELQECPEQMEIEFT